MTWQRIFPRQHKQANIHLTMKIKISDSLLVI
jgi:hypothetical protein